MKTDLLQSCGHCWVFHICWHIEWSSFTASSFRIWNSSTGILSPPLALFVVMLLKAHLTSHSRMSGSRWVITPSWLSAGFLIRTFADSYVFMRGKKCRTDETISKKKKAGWLTLLGFKTHYKAIVNKTVWYYQKTYTQVSVRKRDGMGREVGAGLRMGNMCTPVADSCWCMAKAIQYCKVISLQLK